MLYKKIGLFGGSFDPVHIGHIKLALAAKKEFNLDRVIFIPSGLPPHKKQNKLTSIAHRLKMLRMSIKQYPSFKISRFEIKRKAVTYTYQTVRYFKSKYPKALIYFIMGSDSLNDLNTWKNPKILLKECRFIVGIRKGIVNKKTGAFRNSIDFIKSNVPGISSSFIRERLSQDKLINKYLHKSVVHYIIKRQLYKK